MNEVFVAGGEGAAILDITDYEDEEIPIIFRGLRDMY